MRIVCERGGRTITFAHTRPYWLSSAEGLGEADFDVSSRQAAGMDGELYQGSTANKRNIVIKAAVIPPEGITHDQIREEFFAFLFQGRREPFTSMTETRPGRSTIGRRTASST